MPDLLFLAGGYGSRLGELGEIFPKCLLPVGGIPLLYHWKEYLDGFPGDVHINIHHQRNVMEGFIFEYMPEISIRYEEALLGSMGTVSKLCSEIRDDLIIIHADNCGIFNLTDYYSKFKQAGVPVGMIGFFTDYPTQCGILTLDNDGFVKSWAEKPNNPSSNLANAAIYFVRRDAISKFATSQPFDDSLAEFLWHTFSNELICFVHPGPFMDLGTLDQVKKANRIFNGDGLFPDGRWRDQYFRPVHEMLERASLHEE